jgi:hypothetical protein
MFPRSSKTNTMYVSKYLLPCPAVRAMPTLVLAFQTSWVKWPALG